MKLILVCVAGFVLLGCGGYGSSSSNTSAANIAGNWRFTTTSSKSGGQLVDTGNLAQNGSSISASITISGSSCAQSGTISGAVSGYSITMTLMEGSDSVMFTGTVSTDGKSANGTYTTSGTCTNGDSGTWSGNLVSVTGAFLGRMTSNNAMPVQISAALQEEAGTVTGSATAINSACFNNLAVTGMVSGSEITMSATDEQTGRMLSMAGTVGGNSDAINLNATGDCGGAGVVTLSRVAK